MAGELPFEWHTDFHFPWMEGWLANQPGKTHERNLLVVIPGKDHARAVIMADHYDTAYMEDLYYKERGGKLARVAAAGADDNHSATAALMLAAPRVPRDEQSRAVRLRRLARAFDRRGISFGLHGRAESGPAACGRLAEVPRHRAGSPPLRRP